FLFFFHVTPPPEIYTLSLHDALPIFRRRVRVPARALPLVGLSEQAVPATRAATIAKIQRERLIDCSWRPAGRPRFSGTPGGHRRDRKSTRLNSSHVAISYAVFCLKKK